MFTPVCYDTTRQVLLEFPLQALLDNVRVRGTSTSLVDHGYPGTSAAPALDIKVLVQKMRSVIQDYRTQSQSHLVDKLEFLKDFIKQILIIDGSIGNPDEELEFYTQIRRQRDALANTNIVATLMPTLSTLYELASNNWCAEIARILGVTAPIEGSFEHLLDDKDRLNLFTSGVRGLRERAQKLKDIISIVKVSHETIVADRMSNNTTEDMVSAPAPQVPQLEPEIAWTNLTNFIKAFVDVNSAAADHPGSDSVSVDPVNDNAITEIPTTADEKGCDDEKKVEEDPLGCANAVDPVNDNAITEIPTTADEKGCDDEKKVEEDPLGPSADVFEILKNLGDSTRKVIEQFDVSLSQPLLDQFLCQHPDDYSDSNLLILMRHYRKKYFELQLDTHSAVRALRTYAVAQQKHLSDVVPDNEAQNSDNGTSLTNFIAINASIVRVQKKEADDLHRRYSILEDEWKSVVKIVTEGIEDFKKKIKKELARKREEKRKETRTLEQICLSLGITVFSGAAFLTGGILFPLAGVIAGGSYFAYLIGDIFIKIWDDAEKVEAILQNLDQLCTKVKDSVFSMVCNWSDILKRLCIFDDFHKRIDSPGGSAMLKKAKQDSIDNWVEVREAADNYLKLL